MGRTLVYRLQYTRWLVGFAVGQKASEPVETTESAEVEGRRWGAGDGGGGVQREMREKVGGVRFVTVCNAQLPGEITSVSMCVCVCVLSLIHI